MRNIQLLRIATRMRSRSARWFSSALMLLLATLFGATLAQAQETICARVKIQVKQQLAMERQAFEAEMNIFNTTDTMTLENVQIDVKVTDGQRGQGRFYLAYLLKTHLT